jgi:hypothetical protein
MANCVCKNARKNTGVTSCKALFYAPKKTIFVPTYDSDGVRNKIATGDTLDSTFYNGKINETDASQRWYPLPLLENGVINQAEPTFETPKSGKKYLISEGITSMSLELFEQELKYLSKIKDKNCGEWSVFVVDNYGNMLGETDGTDMFPIMMAQGTLAAIPKFAEEKTSIPKLAVMFDFSEVVFAENLITISKDEWTGVNLLTSAGLLDVNVEITNEAITGFVATMMSDYGTFPNKIPIVGLKKADFTLYNVTDGAPITITTATESPEGVYTFVYAAQGSGDVLSLTLTKNGYEMAATTVVYTS